MDYIKVKSVKHLHKLVNQGKTDYFIQLNGGLRSSKFINEGENKDFFVLNQIDDTEQELSDTDIMDKNQTNIGEAITKGAFWCDNR